MFENNKCQTNNNLLSANANLLISTSKVYSFNNFSEPRNTKGNEMTLKYNLLYIIIDFIKSNNANLI